MNGISCARDKQRFLSTSGRSLRFKKSVTYGRTDGGTDEAGYRVAWTHLKNGIGDFLPWKLCELFEVNWMAGSGSYDFHWARNCKIMWDFQLGVLFVEASRDKRMK